MAPGDAQGLHGQRLCGEGFGREGLGSKDFRSENLRANGVGAQRLEGLAARGGPRQGRALSLLVSSEDERRGGALDAPEPAALPRLEPARRAEDRLEQPVVLDRVEEGP